MANEAVKRDTSTRWINSDGIMLIVKSMIEKERIWGRMVSIKSNDER